MASLKLEIAHVDSRPRESGRQVIFAPCAFCGGTTDLDNLAMELFCSSCGRRFDLFGNYKGGKIDARQGLG